MFCEFYHILLFIRLDFLHPISSMMTLNFRKLLFLARSTRLESWITPALSSNSTQHRRLYDAYKSKMNSSRLQRAVKVRFNSPEILSPKDVCRAFFSFYTLRFLT